MRTITLNTAIEIEREWEAGKNVETTMRKELDKFFSFVMKLDEADRIEYLGVEYIDSHGSVEEYDDYSYGVFEIGALIEIVLRNEKADLNPTIKCINGLIEKATWSPITKKDCPFIYGDTLFEFKMP